MGTDTTGILVFLNTADESEVPLEVASRTADLAPADVEQTVCSFYPPADETFGVDVCSLEGSHRLDPGAYRRLATLIDDADVIHVHPNVVGVIARLAALVSGTRIVTTDHNTHTAAGPMKNAVRGGANWLSDVVVCVSEAVAGSFGRWEDLLLRASGTEKTVVQNGVDIEAVAARADRPAPVSLPEGFVVGSGGRMTPQKNLATVVRAVARVAETVPEVELLLTGDGPQRDSLERLAWDLDIADSVHFTGFLPERADVHALLHRVDAFTLPSRYEGWGVAVGEAMAAEAPVVVGDVPALREVVGDAGLLVDPSDVDGLAAELLALAEDSELRASLGTAGRQRIVERFPIERTAREHVALYRRLGEA
jgi:glycosyltransferase involved in cell wall biosynthesis